MGIVMLVQSCVTLTKTMRDMHEGDKLVNRIEDAKAERIWWISTRPRKAGTETELAAAFSIIRRPSFGGPIRNLR